MKTWNNKFDRFVCIGDAISWTAGAFTLTARIEPDYDTQPTDFDCYSEKDIECWKNDEWCYVGVVIDVAINDVLITKHAASLWGIDCNFGKDNTYLDDVAHDLEDEALERAHVDLERIRKALRVTDTTDNQVI
jgi:hypothetical protein